MKKFLAVLLIVLLSAAITACNKGEKFTVNSGNNINCTVDFIQPWLCASWDNVKWTEHLLKLKAAGYDTVILQSSADYSGGKIVADYTGGITESGYYTTETERIDTLSRLFASAKETGFKVIVGLGMDEAWWNPFEAFKESVYKVWAEMDIFIAQVIYNKYYAEYGDIFAGWYWSFETYTQQMNLETYWADMFNITIDGLEKLNAGLPVMLSPFYSYQFKTDQNTCVKVWTEFFKKCRLRYIDIVAPQDCFGGGPAEFSEETYNTVKMHLESCYNALKAYSKAKFYVNIELFSTEKDVYASPDRIEKQILLARNYAEKLVSFSYSHYFI